MSYFKVLVTSVVVASFFSCQNSSNSDSPIYSLKGTIQGDYDDYIFLNYKVWGDSTYTVKDSALVANNQFEFDYNVQFPLQSYLHLQPPSNVAFVYLDPNSFSVSLTAAEAGEGPTMQNIIQLDSLSDTYTGALKTKIEAFYQKTKNNKDFTTTYIDYVINLVKNNPNNAFAGKVLADNSFLTPRLSVKQTRELYAQMDTLRIDPEDRLLINNALKKGTRFAIGNPVGPIELPDVNDKVISLDASKSRYTLVDFWASWCAPCIRKFPEYKELLGQYKPEDFAIYGVSLDEQTNSWRNMIDQRELTWTQVIDSAGFDGPTAKNYYLFSIPSNFLVDQDGNILKTNIKPEELTKLLNSNI